MRLWWPAGAHGLDWGKKCTAEGGTGGERRGPQLPVATPGAWSGAALPARGTHGGVGTLRSGARLAARWAGPGAEPLYIAGRPLLLPRGAVRVRLGARGAVALAAGRRPPANQDWGEGREGEAAGTSGASATWRVAAPTPGLCRPTTCLSRPSIEYPSLLPPASSASFTLSLPVPSPSLSPPLRERPGCRPNPAPSAPEQPLLEPCRWGTPRSVAPLRGALRTLRGWGEGGGGQQAARGQAGEGRTPGAGAGAGQALGSAPMLWAIPGWISLHQMEASPEQGSSGGCC